MPDEMVRKTRLRPVLGCVSVGIAVLVSVIIVLPIARLYSTVKLEASAAGGIGAVAGGVNAWVLYVILMLIVGGVGSSVLGLVRGERMRWLHAVGVVVNLVAPVAAVALFLLYR